jgi:hypothetical protein
LSNIGSAIVAAWPGIRDGLEQYASAFWQWVKRSVPPLLRELGSLLESLGSWIWNTALPAIGSQLAAWGDAFWKWVQPKIVPMLKELGSLLEQLGSWIWNTALPAIGQKLADWGQAFVEWIGPKILPMLGELGKLLLKLQEWLWGTALPAIAAKLLSWGEAFAAWVIPAGAKMMLALFELPFKLAAWIWDNKAMIMDSLYKWADAFKEWVPKAWDGLVKAIDDAFPAIDRWVASKLDDLGKIGQKIVLAIAAGIKAAPSVLVDAIKSLLPSLGGVLSGLGGAVGKMLGFADGGPVPGPIGAPQLAVVHGGEFVLSNDMLRTGYTPSTPPAQASSPQTGHTFVTNYNGITDVRALADMNSREVGWQLRVA